jgi:hypothetical protein
MHELELDQQFAFPASLQGDKQLALVQLPVVERVYWYVGLAFKRAAVGGRIDQYADFFVHVVEHPGVRQAGLQHELFSLELLHAHWAARFCFGQKFKNGVRSRRKVLSFDYSEDQHLLLLLRSAQRVLQFPLILDNSFLKSNNRTFMVSNADWLVAIFFNILSSASIHTSAKLAGVRLLPLLCSFFKSWSPTSLLNGVGCWSRSGYAF